MENKTRHNLYTLSNATPTLVGPMVVHAGSDFTIQNANETGYIYLGDENVSSTSYGFRILPNHSISFELPGNATIYAISSINLMKAAVIVIGLESGS